MIKLQRIKNDGNTTIGELFINGFFQCFILEDEPREVKVKGETRIPAGKYKIGLRTVGGFHERLSKRFKDMHIGMLQILDVPGFEYILIHPGNTDKDTDGCLITGSDVLDNFTVSGSTMAYKKIYPIISKMVDSDEDVYIEIFDEEKA